ncbi:MAG TPA: hypothetical protein VK363_14830 [Pyrinomonadaceae bacterium]|nr:hypothetical protein [Pyrinomonadaceae bacterium]
MGSKLTEKIRAASSKEHAVALSVAAMTAIGSILFVAYSIGYAKGHDDLESMYIKSCPSYIWASHVDFPHVKNFWHLNIAAALLLNTVCLWWRSFISYVLSALTAVWVGLIFVWWYFDSVAFLRSFEISDYSQLNVPDFQHIGMLRGAIWWDIVTLLVAGSLFLWVIKVSAGAHIMLRSEKLK